MPGAVSTNCRIRGCASNRRKQIIGPINDTKILLKDEKIITTDLQPKDLIFFSLMLMSHSDI